MSAPTLHMDEGVCSQGPFSVFVCHVEIPVGVLTLIRSVFHAMVSWSFQPTVVLRHFATRGVRIEPANEPCKPQALFRHG